MSLATVHIGFESSKFSTKMLLRLFHGSGYSLMCAAMSECLKISEIQGMEKVGPLRPRVEPRQPTQ